MWPEEKAKGMLGKVYAGSAAFRCGFFRCGRLVCPKTDATNRLSPFFFLSILKRRLPPCAKATGGRHAALPRICLANHEDPFVTAKPSFGVRRISAALPRFQFLPSLRQASFWDSRHGRGYRIEASAASCCIYNYPIGPGHRENGDPG